MKNLANCTPIEFMGQTLKLKDSLTYLLKAVKLDEIRSQKPDFIDIPEDASEEETLEIVNKNKELLKNQAMENLSLILYKFFEENAEKTLEVLAYSCFVEPEDVNNYMISDYLDCLMDMFEDKAVRRFFLSMARIQKQNIITFPA